MTKEEKEILKKKSLESQEKRIRKLEYEVEELKKEILEYKERNKTSFW